MIAETTRLHLKEISLSQTDFIIQLLNSPKWLQNIGDRNVRDKEAAENYIRNLQKAYNKDGFGLWIMELKSTNEPIGMCGLVNRENLPHPDIGFALLPDYEGVGYGYEAASKTMELVKTQFKLPTVLAITAKHNTASQRLLEKVGLHFDRLDTCGYEEELMVYST